jgi:hypothetical protein
MHWDCEATINNEPMDFSKTVFEEMHVQTQQQNQRAALNILH